MLISSSEIFLPVPDVPRLYTPQKTPVHPVFLWLAQGLVPASHMPDRVSNSA